ncbi:hypothetical protein [Nostoc sp. UHCC 0251]|uniref:hypothetical protein n=1 Tax=Nostoc sp. UHCC 0251 TaxID=3110240 RepID=UPI002B1F38CC|nr:hypothetical protein [Nostoc sp. UHCC 0251]MEA5624838.1 hypothetical protein [Nostoc sp. UHCC 0251]
MERKLLTVFGIFGYGKICALQVQRYTQALAYSGRNAIATAGITQKLHCTRLYQERQIAQR